MGAYIIGMYGIYEWFADIDQNRKYWQEGQGIIHSVLDYLTYIDFGEFMKEIGFKWEDATEYRQRYLIRAIKSKSLF